MSRAKVWVCAACGKVGKSRLTIGDESCYLHGVEVWADSVLLDATTGRAIKAAGVAK